MARALAFPLCVAAILICSGCVAVPFATPPLQATLGTGVRSTSHTDSPSDFDVPLQVRAAVHPFGFVPEWLQRDADVGFGYLYEGGSGGRTQGLYLEASGVLLSGPLSNTVGRLSARLQGQFLFEDQHGPFGEGVALQLTGELSDFTEGPFDSQGEDGGSFGYVYGERGAGLYLEGGWFQLGDRSGWTATTGILVRIPASVGFAWTWIWALDN
jgi:hypothetical protein